MARWRWVLGLVAVVALAAGALLVLGGDDDGGDDDGDARVELTPSTAVVSTGPADGELEAVDEVTDVAVGDSVGTDEPGRAELTYEDGSFTRLDGSTLVTVIALEDPVRGTRLGLEFGQVWQRVRELTGSEKNEIETPVGVASVRGTAYSVRCTRAQECTFVVAEGEVVVNPDDGGPLTLQPGEQVVVDDSGAGPVTPAQPTAWVTENLDQDEEEGVAEPPTSTFSTVTTSTSSSLPSSPPTSTAGPTTIAGIVPIDASPNGTFSVTTTVTSVSGVFGVEPGDTGGYTYQLSGSCPGAGCQLFVDVVETGTRLQLARSGSSYQGTATIATDCRSNDDGGILVVGGIVNDVQLSIEPTRVSGDRVTRFSGTLSVTGRPTDAATAAGCTGSSQTNSLTGARQ